MNAHLQPWTVSPDGFPTDGFISDRLEYLLQYAILAPSPHNTQPWLFRINTHDVEIFADPRRGLTVTDPHGREMFLACGAALQNLRVAAGYFGQKVAAALFPDPAQPTLLARMTLQSGGEVTAEDVVLFHAITQRRTNRGEFSPEPIPESVMQWLGEAAVSEGAWLSFLVEEETKGAVAAMVAEADRRQWASWEFRGERAHWMRTDTEHQADGIPSRELGVETWLGFAGPAVVRTFNRGAHQAARDVEIAVHSPLLLVLGTDEDSPVEWVRAGQAMQRVLLTAQSEGVSASHLNQAVELEEFRAPLAALAGREGGFPQVLLRMGYGRAVGPTPRRDLRHVVLCQESAKAPPH